MNTLAEPFTIDPLLGYASLTALRGVHLKLIEVRRTRSENPAFQSAVVSFIIRGVATGLILDDDSERLAAQSILDYWANALHRSGVDAPDPTLADFDVNISPKLADDLCPYVGLEAFREGDELRFFGRQQLIIELIERVGEQRLLAVVGPSGSGKSSVVRAGLIPALKSGTTAARTRYVCLTPMVPGSEPLSALARVLRPDGVEAARWNGVVAGMLAHPDYLTKLVAALTKRPVVITVDQFEELYTLCTSENERRAFVANLLHLLKDKTRPHVVVITMRIDFEPFIQTMPELQNLFVAGRASVLPLSPAELREAVELPAQQIGLKFEKGVVERLLHDIVGEPAGLPLLQFTLLRLWEERQRNRVTHEIYDRVGGGRLALARSADAFYERLIPEEQVTVRRILLRMVRPGSGSEVTSARILRSALFSRSEDFTRVKRVLVKLIDARLVRLTKGETDDDNQVEVAHEALVRNWPRLVEWTEQERDSLRQRLRLGDSARQWEEAGRDATLLWRGTLLDEATRHDDLDKIERAFVRAGVAADAKIKVDKLRAEEEREQARERALAQAQALAAEQTRRATAEQERASAEQLRATAEQKRAEEQTQRVEAEQQRAEEQSCSARRLQRLSLWLTVALLAAIGIALFAGAQGIVLGQLQRDADVAKADNAIAQAQRGAALATAGVADTQAKAAAINAADAQTAGAVAQQTAVSAQLTTAPLQLTVTVAVGQFEVQAATATVLQTNLIAGQASASTAQSQLVTAQRDAQAVAVTAAIDRQNAAQAQQQAQTAQASVGEAKETAAAAQNAAATAQRLAEVAEDKSNTLDTATDATLIALKQTQEALGPAFTIVALSSTPTPTPTRTPTG